LEEPVMNSIAQRKKGKAWRNGIRAYYEMREIIAIQEAG